MSDSDDLIEQAKGMDDPAKIVKVSKVCGLDISEAEAKAFVETKELPDSAMDAIAGGSGKNSTCPKCGGSLEVYVEEIEIYHGVCTKTCNNCGYEDVSHTYLGC